MKRRYLYFQSLTTFAFLFNDAKASTIQRMMLILNFIVCATALFVIGVLLNGFEAWMIVRHSPSEMRVYSQILLQICAIDIIALVIGPITQPVCSVYGGGGTRGGTTNRDDHRRRPTRRCFATKILVLVNYLPPRF